MSTMLFCTCMYYTYADSPNFLVEASSKEDLVYQLQLLDIPKYIWWRHSDLN